MRFLAVKNFERFQHYKDRNPLWIKLYRDLLLDMAFIQLPEAAQAQLVKLWLVASTCGNRIPWDERIISQSIKAGKRLYLSELLASGFLYECYQDASNPLAESEPDASPTRARTRVREEKERETSLPAPEVRAREDDAFGDLRRLLVRAANQGLERRYPTLTKRYTPGNGRVTELATLVRDEHIDPEFAAGVIVALMESRPEDEPPGAMNYFVKPVRDKWAQEVARRDAAEGAPIEPIANGRHPRPAPRSGMHTTFAAAEIAARYAPDEPAA